MCLTTIPPSAQNLGLLWSMRMAGLQSRVNKDSLLGYWPDVFPPGYAKGSGEPYLESSASVSCSSGWSSSLVFLCA